MSMGKGKTVNTIFSLVLFGMTAQVLADTGIEANGGSYVSSDGMILKTGLDDCLQTGTYSTDATIGACEGADADTAEANASADTDTEAVADASEADTAVADNEAQDTATDATDSAEQLAATAASDQQEQIETREFSEQALFDSRSAELTSAGETAMQGMFSAMSEYKDIKAVSVIGHTDNRGEEAFNQALSEQRAQTVAKLIADQFPDATISSEGMGESSPVSSNNTPEGRQLNRRVEVTVTATRAVFN